VELRDRVVDVAFGGAFYASVEETVEPGELPRLIELGRELKREVEAWQEVVHPVEPELRDVDGVIFWQEEGVDPLTQRNVTVFADGEVDRSPCGSGTSARLALLDAACPYERGDITEADRDDAVVLDERPRVEAPRRDVDDDVVLAFVALHDPGVERPGDERDRPVAARGRVAGVVEEDDAEIGARLGLDDVAPIHVCVPARLVNEEAANVIQPVVRVAPLLEDRVAAQRVHTARDDPERLARGVVVDRTNLHPLDPSGDRPWNTSGREVGRLQGFSRSGIRESGSLICEQAEPRRRGSVVVRGPPAPRDSSTARQGVAAAVW
jgi:hypothetical protein